MTLKQQIASLKKQLEHAQNHTYVYNTESLHCSDGEFYMEYNNGKTIIFEVNSLFNDLPFIINQVVKEQAKMHKWKLDLIKDELKEL